MTYSIYFYNLDTKQRFFFFQVPVHTHKKMSDCKKRIEKQNTFSSIKELNSSHFKRTVNTWMFFFIDDCSIQNIFFLLFMFACPPPRSTSHCATVRKIVSLPPANKHSIIAYSQLCKFGSYSPIWQIPIFFCHGIVWFSYSL